MQSFRGETVSLSRRIFLSMLEMPAYRRHRAERPVAAAFADRPADCLAKAFRLVLDR
jgi:hypothetical protein